MATEPTLGTRILAAASEHSQRPPGEPATRAVWARLRALCARADAAERGMVATVEHERHWCAFHDAVRVAAGRDVIDAFLSVAVLASSELNAARDSWLAITQEVASATE